MTTPKTALSIQVGGSHYKDCAIQPVEFIEANKLGFLEGCAIKRLARHDKPTGKGRQDIEKVIHEMQLLLELRYPQPVAEPEFPLGVEFLVGKPAHEPGRLTIICDGCTTACKSLVFGRCERG